MIRHFALALILLTASTTFAGNPLYLMPQSATTNPCDYSLTKPIPKDQLWQLQSDRPSRANSAYTVAPGHLYIESGFLYTNNSNEGQTAHRFDIANTQLRLGVLCDLELDLTFTPFIWEQINRPRETLQGFGDVEVAAKYSLWQTEKSALSVRPAITFPTGTDSLSQGAVGVGLNVPYSYNVNKEINLFEMPGISYEPDSNGPGYHVELLNAVGIQYSLTEKLKSFGELFVQANTEEWSEVVATADIGLMYQFTDNFQVDVGAYIGLTDDSDDLVSFVGATYRL
ncbi:MAG TPA: transporter [Tepidisphaeraceae bacterium]|jgi:hypothetical protein